jgi:hypothetical protein
MTVSLAQPDLAIALKLDPYAPRASRHHVGQVDRPSPDLRDAVMLLTSELVTRAFRHSETLRAAAGESDAAPPLVELRVWMPEDIVRVELWAAVGLLSQAAGADGYDGYDMQLLDSIADRWSLQSGGDEECMWFEIDRHPVPAGAGI